MKLDDTEVIEKGLIYCFVKGSVLSCKDEIVVINPIKDITIEQIANAAQELVNDGIAINQAVHAHRIIIKKADLKFHLSKIQTDKLKAIGFDSNEIIEALNKYNESLSVGNSFKDFYQFLQGSSNVGQIGRNWKPSNRLINRLISANIPDTFIKLESEIFLLRQQELKTTSENWETYFFNYCIKIWRSKTQSFDINTEAVHMAPDWLPGENVINFLSGHNLTRQFILESALAFRERNSSNTAMANNWNELFVNQTLKANQLESA